MKSALVFVLLSVTALQALDIGSWENLRFSGRTDSGQAFLRSEITVNNINTNELLYTDGSTITTVNQTLYDAQTQTYQSSFPSPAEGRNLGLRLQAGTSAMHVLPLPYYGTGLPALALMTRSTTDAQGEVSTNFLDLTGDFFARSDTKFFAAMQNRGGGFPFNNTFYTNIYSYMCVMADPDSDPADPNTIVWAMVYMNVSIAGLTPGLYRIEDGALNRIGNIEYQVVSGSNLLTMGCNISDLMADPAFTAWYDPAEPEIGFTSITAITTLTMTTTQQDMTPGARIFPRPLYFSPGPNQVPVLTEPIFHASQDAVWFGVTYTDADGRFSLTAEVVLGTGQTFQLYPQSLDYSGPVLYRTTNLVSVMNEYDDTEALFRFSDDNISFGTASLPFYYIRSLLVPLNVHLTAQPAGLLLQWDEVTQTGEGNPVTVTSYRIEVSALPDFSEFSTLDTVALNSYFLPAAQLLPQSYYRITAIKE
jgi:hypothetical protein